MMKTLLLISVLLLTACVTPPVIDPTGPGGAVIAVDPTGETLNDGAYNLWLSEGVPTSYFTPEDGGYHITNFYLHQADDIRVAHANK